MAEGFGNLGGGIYGILRELDAYEDAIRADLIHIGRSLDDVPDRLSWRDLKAILQTAPRDSAYARAKIGPDIEWVLQTEVLAGIYDQLSMLRWGLGGGKGPRPKLIDRPSRHGQRKKYGEGESWTPQSFDRWIGLMERGVNELDS